MKKLLSYAACLSLLFFAVSATSRAQSANLSGSVKDSSGGVIPKATVTAENENTGVKRTATTNAAGIYELPFLLPGTYRVTVEAQGFQLTSRPGVVLNVQQAA